MKKYLFLILAVLLVFSCKTYKVKREVRKKSLLNQFKQSGIILRIPHSSAIPLGRFNQSLSHWLDGYQRVNTLKIIEDASSELNMVTSEFDRFLQFSNKEDFLKPKVFGILKQYLKKNEEELNKIFTENELDSLIIYEVDGALSPEMQFMDFSSMILVISQEYEIAYMDRQFNSYTIEEYDKEIVTNHLLDKISGRFLELMEKLDYLDD
jgi:hypothetical protein